MKGYLPLPLWPKVENVNVVTGVDFGEARGRRPLWSDTERGEICLAPSVFYQVIPTWQQEI